jgi:hypothetical protein
MYLIKRTSKRKVINHGQTWDKPIYIPAGTPYVQIHNGTIGKGARYKNYGLKDIQRILNN